MSQIKKAVVQSGLNTLTSVMIPTGLTVDGKSGWNIKRITAKFASPESISSAVDTFVFLQLNTEAGSQSFEDNDSVAYLMWFVSGMAGSTSAFQLMPSEQWNSDLGRLTVQPNLYITVSSQGLVSAAVFYVEVEYEVVKLTDLEVMRLMQGGA
jgi:hypothetical protein